MPAKILIVEDHDDSREILAHMLRHLNYEPLEAATGEEAIEKALNESPDLIIMDLRLPGINGVEATRRLKQNPKTARIPIIAYTASEHQDYKHKALAAGMAEFLMKPTPHRVFKQIIEKFLSTKP